MSEVGKYKHFNFVFSPQMVTERRRKSLLCIIAEPMLTGPLNYIAYYGETNIKF